MELRGIHEVAVEMALKDKVLFRAAGAGERGVAQHYGREGMARVVGIGHHYFPSRLAWRRAQRVDGAAPGGEHRRAHVLRAQDGNRLIDGESFANASGIKLDSRGAEVDGS